MITGCKNLKSERRAVGATEAGQMSQRVRVVSNIKKHIMELFQMLPNNQNTSNIN